MTSNMYLIACPFLLAVMVLTSGAQTCSPPAIVANANSANIFSPEQEMILGDLTVERLAADYREIRDPVLLAFVQSIADRLIRHLPPTGLRFRFHLIDYPEANAFNIPGGHIYISRKLISIANNEDELAGVMAHELGHATVHHGAIDMSVRMKKVLRVTSLGDRKDIAEKYNLLIENARTKSVGERRGHEDDQQLEADKIGFYAMVAAGYDPDATFSFFDRLTESEGKTGSWLGNLFGSIPPEQKRLREMSKATKDLPQGCREGRVAQAGEEYIKWQADVVLYRDQGRREELPGLVWRKEISSKLRSDVSHLEVSTDGTMILAQDDFAIMLINRSGADVIMQIPATDADDAHITPDNKSVVFTTDDLRFERWDIASKTVAEVKELVLRSDCWEHELSPNGNYLACVDTRTTIKLVDTRTGKKLWEKKEFYPLTFMEYIAWLEAEKGDREYNVSFFRIEFTPDSRYAVFSRSNKYRFKFTMDLLAEDSSEDTAVAIDLTSMKPVDIGGDLKRVTARSYIFLDPGRIVGTSAAKVDDAGIFTFPAGKRIAKLEFSGERLMRTGNSDYVAIKPLANGATGLFDLKRNAIVAAVEKRSITVWNDIEILEAASGKLRMRQIAYDDKEKKLDGKDIATVDLPVSAINGLSTTETSPDFAWIMFSSRSRGGIWDLKTGERVMFTRGFKGGLIDTKGAAVAHFPSFRDDPHNLALLNAKAGEATPIRDLPKFGARQYGRFTLTRQNLKESGSRDELRSMFAKTSEEQAESRLLSDVSFELKDWVHNKVIWTRDFKGVAPRYSFDEYSGRLILYWGLGTDQGKARLKETPSLAAQAESLGDKENDYLIEVIDGFAQKTIGTMLVETGKGSFSVETGSSEGDWLALNDSEGRVLVYSLKSASIRCRFFGTKAILNPARNQIAIENSPGEVFLYNLDTEERIGRYAVGGRVVFFRFNLEGNQMLMLSDSQTAYLVDLTKSTTPRNL